MDFSLKTKESIIGFFKRVSSTSGVRLQFLISQFLGGLSLLYLEVYYSNIEFWEDTKKGLLLTVKNYYDNRFL